MNKISFIIKEQYKGEQLKGPLRITVVFFMPLPQSLSQKKKDSLYGQPHCKRSDCDNLQKLLLDCITMSGLIVDDAQFAEIHASKVYSNNACTVFNIETMT